MNTRSIVRVLILSGFMLASSVAFAQEEVLPRGVGTYRFGYRQFTAQTEKYNAAGEKESLGRPFDKNLSGQGLVNGDGGDQLATLAKELQKFDSFANTPDSLLNQLSLGQMHGDIHAEINAKILSGAYGVTNRLSLFIGVPYISAAVHSGITFVPGSNNANAISQRLGELGFDQLRDGLTQASAINEDTIRQQITDQGYEPLGLWQHSGIGDIQTGSIYSVKSRFLGKALAFSTLKTTLNIPTGYVESADILTDVSTGTGYWGLANRFSQKLLFSDLIWVGGAVEYGYNFANSSTKRVPVGNESIVAQDRRTSVTINPGSDVEGQLMTGMRLGILRPSYVLGTKRHGRDQYSGPIEGNYGALSADSAETQTYHDITLSLQTADLYRTKRFPIPMTFDLNAHIPIAGKNTADERYFQIEIGSFFSTRGTSKSSRQSTSVAH